MKRFLFIASCAFLTAGLFSSCQKEEKSVLDLAKDLTTELQKVTDLKTADSIAPRVQVLNKRLQDATVRPFAASATSLQRSSDEDSPGQEGAALQDALKALAKEVGRVQASLPVATYDGDVDRDKLILAVGAANGAGDSAPASRRKSVGTAHMKGESPKNETPGTFSEFYGSTKLAEALGYTAEPGSIGAFDMEEEPAPVPAAAPIAEEEEEPAAADEAPADEAPADDPSAAGDEEPASPDSEGTDSTDSAPAVEDGDSPDSADSSSGDDVSLPSLDLDSDSSSDDSSDDSSDSSSDDSSDDEDFGIEI